MGTLVSLARRLLAVLSIVALMSCGSPPQHASAQPPGFPDLGGFAPAAVDDYVVPPVKGLPYAHFSTPYNVQCWFEAGEAVPAWSSQDINCLGEIPGLGSGSCVIGKAASAGPAYGLSQTGQSCGAPYSAGNLLDVGQKLSYRNATCAVGPDRLIACLDTTSGQHGFVLKPSGSQAF